METNTFNNRGVSISPISLDDGWSFKWNMVIHSNLLEHFFLDVANLQWWENQQKHHFESHHQDLYIFSRVSWYPEVNLHKTCHSSLEGGTTQKSLQTHLRGISWGWCRWIWKLGRFKNTFFDTSYTANNQLLKLITLCGKNPNHIPLKISLRPWTHSGGTGSRVLEIGGEISTTGHVHVVHGATYGHVGIPHYLA